MKPYDPDTDSSWKDEEDEPSSGHASTPPEPEDKPMLTLPNYIPHPLNSINTKLSLFNEGVTMLFWAYVIMAGAAIIPQLAIGGIVGFIVILVAQFKMGRVTPDMKTAFRIQLFSLLGYILLVIAVLVHFGIQLFGMANENTLPPVDIFNRPLRMIVILSIAYSAARVTALFFQTRPLELAAKSNKQTNVLSSFKVPFLLLSASTIFSVLLSVLMTSQMKALLTTMAKTGYSKLTPDSYLTYFTSSPTATPLARISSLLLLASYILYAVALNFLRNHQHIQMDV